MPGILHSSSLGLVFGVVVVVVVWRSRSAGVVKKWWWGSGLCHVAVRVLESMCQSVRVNVPVLNEACVGSVMQAGWRTLRVGREAWFA